MLKKRITFTNPFTDQEVTEEHYFHISKADLVEMEMEEHSARYMKDGEELTGMQAKIQRIVDSEDGKAIMTELKDIIRRAYGRKEGDRFVKSKETTDDFAASEAFSQLLFELCTNATAATEFINGIVPNNLEAMAAEIAAQAQGATQGPTAAGDAQRNHPSDTAAQAPPIASTTPETPAMDKATSVFQNSAPPEPTPASTTPPPPPAVPETEDRGTIATERVLPAEPRILTTAEMAEMDPEEFKSGLISGRYKIA
jgi:hypothetical protein